MKSRKHYFIFGDDYTNGYDESGVEGIDFEYGLGDVLCFDQDRDNINRLVNASFGWGSYRAITEQEYNKAISERNKRQIKLNHEKEQ